MAAKTVEFLKINLLQRSSKNEICYNQLFDILDKIFVYKSKDHGDYKTLDLTPAIKPEGIEPKMVLDILEMDPLMLFARICKKKSNSAILRRDYDSLEADEVFTPSQARKMGIEVFTYFIINFSTGIIAIANAKDAPGPSIINDIFDNYNKTYIFEFENIPNKEGINVLYNSNSPEITGLEFEVPVPNARFLQQVLDLDENEITKIVGDNVQRTTVLLRSDPYKAIEKNSNKVKEIIDILQRKKGLYPKIKVVGKSADFTSREFDLHARYFTYPIEVRRFRTEGGQKKEYRLEQISEQFRKGLVKAYSDNEELLLAIANREKERNEENI